MKVKRTESPLDQDIVTMPEISSETTNNALNSDFTSLVVDRTEITETSPVAETASNKTDRNEYWRKYKEEKRKSQNLENIIQALSSPVKRNVCRNLSNEVLDFDQIICEGLLKYLRQLWNKKQFHEFYNLLWNVCGEQLIDNPSFINWLGSKLSIRCYR